ncbi:ELMO/CED-12 family-domain-containing protein [Linnemannia elongata]|nr:ELMO/CED-12 family-domain-containing protein [Linnemannia elongata]
MVELDVRCKTADRCNKSYPNTVKRLESRRGTRKRVTCAAHLFIGFGVFQFTAVRPSTCFKKTSLIVNYTHLTLRPAARKLQYALERVASTHQLAREINQRVHTKYDSTNPAHERKLMLLWDLLRPHEKLEGRYTKQWTEIGFQGKDPATDFRGMGMLGLDDLVYYAKYYPMSSKNALECSHDAISWYSFAIVGINITSFAVQTLRTRQLQYYLFLNGTDRSVYHELYCYLFHRFNAYWSTLEPKPSIMDFERVFADFKIMMERQLARRKLMMLRYDTKENMLSGHGHHQPPSAVAAPPRLPQDEAGEHIELETKKSK